jgi:hypothetical protein
MSYGFLDIAVTPTGGCDNSHPFADFDRFLRPKGSWSFADDSRPLRPLYGHV